MKDNEEIRRRANKLMIGTHTREAGPTPCIWRSPYDVTGFAPCVKI